MQYTYFLLDSDGTRVLEGGWLNVERCSHARTSYDWNVHTLSLNRVLKQNTHSTTHPRHRSSRRATGDRLCVYY